MDTKLKSIKYSNANKFICVFLACVMVAVFMCNLFSTLKYLYFFGISQNNGAMYIASDVFADNLMDDISNVVQDINSNAYEKAKQEYLNDFLKAYKSADKENRYTKEDILKKYSHENNYEVTEDDGEGILILSIKYSNSYVYDNVYKSYTAWDYYGDNEKEYFEVDGDYYSYMNYYIAQRYYCGDNQYYYPVYMTYDKEVKNNLLDPSYTDMQDFDGINFGHNDNYVLNIMENRYDNEHNTTDYSEKALINIEYYAIADDNSVVTNVENEKDFIKNLVNSNDDYEYLIYDSKSDEFITSNSLSFVADRSSRLKNTTVDYKLYLRVNKNFDAGVDFYSLQNQCYESVAYKSIINIFVCLIISFVVIIMLAVFSCRLAGHKNDEISLAEIDKMPFDLHFILMVLCVVAGVASLCFLFNEYFLSLNYLNAYYASDSLSEYQLFYYSQLFVFAICAIAVLIWLVILSFATSLSRAIKAHQPILKKMITGRLAVLLVKLVAVILKAVWWATKKIFHGIKMLFKYLFSAIAIYTFKPKYIHKRSVMAVVLYTLFNIISISIAICMISSYYDFWNFCGVLGILLILAFDGYTIYKAVSYTKKLDDIIESSEKGIPVPYNTDTLPQSLKILADSLENTQSQLSVAVNKAVKDERTKTELITNVSHDLKTPLTSVINYIDLLQKCNIEGEDANKYVKVIAEKSAKLKRLIEDLIEASKVSTGNVTINKTLLNLNELATQAIVEETADIEKNNLKIIYDESGDKHIVYADGTKIYRVFENLLSNARKYSASGSRIYARVYSDNDYGYFELKNISKEQLNISAIELTERFVRGDQSRNEEGNGLGLSIAKELCRLNNGELIITIDGDLFKATVKLPKKEQ